ncbi:MAG TPA: 50S ribosomal protein L13 [archaeon]|nr:50S ribosomal protein L13 [archaeon]
MSAIIDGKNAVLGRVASHTAKQLLKGEEVAICNADKIIITGRKKDIVNKYLARRRRGSPQHGPFFPKNSDAIVRRTIRGMLPKTKKGREALKKLTVIKAAKENAKQLEEKEIKTAYITVGELAKTLGGK